MKIEKKVLALLCCVWVLIVLYPNPAIVPLNVYRVFNPPVDPVAVRDISAQLPNNANVVDEFLGNELEYDYDWKVYSVPWYFPTPAEVWEKGEGDCKGRAILFASILEEKGIDYEIHFSPIHFWVDYEGKQIQAFEEKYEMGRPHPYSEILDKWTENLWYPMPLGRKVLLFAGLACIILANKIVAIGFWVHRKKPLAALFKPSK